MEPEETKTIQASVGIAGNHAGSNSEVKESDSYDDKPSVGKEELLELGHRSQKETLRDVKLGLGLTKFQLASSGSLRECVHRCAGEVQCHSTPNHVD